MPVFTLALELPYLGRSDLLLEDDYLDNETSDVGSSGSTNPPDGNGNNKFSLTKVVEVTGEILYDAKRHCSIEMEQVRNVYVTN